MIKKKEWLVLIVVHFVKVLYFTTTCAAASAAVADATIAGLLVYVLLLGHLVAHTCFRHSRVRQGGSVITTTIEAFS